MTKTARHWINSSWDDGGAQGTSRNPATGAELGSFADADVDVTKRAIAAAKTAFHETDWKENRQLRARVLNAMADVFEQAMQDLAGILSAENGKPFGEAMFEVSTVPSKLRYWAGMALTSQGRASEPSPGRFSMVLRQPIGVAGIIVPWNAPVALAVRSLAPALAAGTTAVIKFPAQTAQTNAMFSSLLAGLNELPTGVINTFTESGDAGSRYLVDSPDVPAISFTGSTATGRAIAAAGAKHLKRLGLELGGKTPMIVMDDANIDVVAAVAVKALTTFSGQFCMTSSRLLVQKGIAAALRDRLSAALAKVRLGAGNDPSTDMGPLIDAANVKRVAAVVDAAIDAGAIPLVRGGPSLDTALQNGAFFHPTFLEVKDSGAAIVQKETFGPVLTMEIFESERDAITLANHSEYGLAASVWSGDAARSFRIGRELEAGTVWINNWALIYDEFEEGGFKQSGLGRLNGASAMDTFLEYKHIAFDAGTVAR
jgi:betaine-aldehyde dehydrogenase